MIHRNQAAGSARAPHGPWFHLCFDPEYDRDVAVSRPILLCNASVVGTLEKRTSPRNTSKNIIPIMPCCIPRVCHAPGTLSVRCTRSRSACRRWAGMNFVRYASHTTGPSSSSSAILLAFSLHHPRLAPPAVTEKLWSPWPERRHAWHTTGSANSW